MAELMEARVPDIGSDSGVPVIELLVKVGDVVGKDQGLVTLESDKATMEVPSPFAGTIRELLVKVGDEITTGAVVAMIEASDTAVAAKADAPVPAAPVAVASSAPVAPAPPAPAKPTAPPTSVAAAPSPGPVTPAATGPRLLDADALLPGALPYASPAVRVFARELGVDLSQVKGSERGGRISKVDVQQHVKAVLSAGLPSRAGSTEGGLQLIPWPQVDFSKFGEIELQPRSRINKISGANLARNWAMIPHVTQFEEADITEMEAFRKKLGEEHKDIKITPLVFLIKASVAALKKYPGVQCLA